jgi:thiol-disulfide isomerase/thioredoxin
MRKIDRTIPLLIAVLLLLQTGCNRPTEQQPSSASPSRSLSTAPPSSPSPSQSPAPDTAVSAQGAEATGSKEEKRPEVDFADLSGKKYSLKDFKNRVVLVVYWATWCPPCRKEIPVLNQLQEKYSKRDMLLLAISQDEQLDTVRDYMSKDKLGQSINYPVVYGRDYVEQFGMVRALPTIFLMDKNGKVVIKHEGTSSYEQLAAVIEEHL